jgi:biotin synthase
MCYAIPGRIVSIQDRSATIDYFGERREAGIIGTQGRALRAGDYVYAQGGIVVDRIAEPEALAILDSWKERFFELKKRDAEIAKTAKTKNKNALASVLDKAESGALLARSEMEQVIRAEDSGSLESIYASANRIRSRELGNSCCVHGIIEFSNHCKNACAYCGINKNNTKIKRYRMSPDEIVETAEHAFRSLGFKALVLQSGEDDYYSDEMLEGIIRRIREKCGILIFMSIGERTFGCYKKLYEAGAYGALLRFETSNPKIYSMVRQGKKLEARVALIRKLVASGFIVATGFMVGLPGATGQDLINDILLTKSLKPDMYSFGPFIPHPQTPLAGTRGAAPDYALRAISLSRLIDPKAKILATTALETLSRGKKDGLCAGANSLMINLTPDKYKLDYDLYPGKARCAKTGVQDEIRETLGLLHSLGRAPTDLGT